MDQVRRDDEEDDAFEYNSEYLVKLESPEAEWWEDEDT